jgi:molecular chaperone DnaK (HSP70)
MILVEYKGEIKTFTPEEISAMVVQKMKQVCLQYALLTQIAVVT